MESLNNIIWTDEEAFEEQVSTMAMGVACSVSITSCSQEGSSPGSKTPISDGLIDGGLVGPAWGRGGIEAFCGC